MNKAERDLRQAVVEGCRQLNSSGINQGTSGNISVRHGTRMLVSPSAIPYDTMEPGMVASMSLEDESGAWEGPLKPSTEWPFHHRILRERPDAHAVVHAHPTYCTTLAIAHKEIPACHYMVACFGGNNVRCADYVRFGTDELSRLALAALKDRTACLLANHGMITIGETLAKAMWRAVELETIARQYYFSLQIGGPNLLSDAEVDETIAAFAGYGIQDDAGRVTTGGARSPRRGRKRTA